MFDKKHDEQDQITIDMLIEKLCIQIDDAADYQDESTTTMIENLAKLVAIKNEYNSFGKISPEAILGACVNLGGIITILKFEKFGVITSKALSFVQKVRL